MRRRLLEIQAERDRKWRAVASTVAATSQNTTRTAIHLACLTLLHILTARAPSRRSRAASIVHAKIKSESQRASPSGLKKSIDNPLRKL